MEAKPVVDGDEVADNLSCVAERCGWGNAERLLTASTVKPLDLAVRLGVMTTCVNGFEP
jgi:hypothetical protein